LFLKNVGEDGNKNFIDRALTKIWLQNTCFKLLEIRFSLQKKFSILICKKMNAKKVQAKMWIENISVLF